MRSSRFHLADAGFWRGLIAALFGLIGVIAAEAAPITSARVEIGFQGASYAEALIRGEFTGQLNASLAKQPIEGFPAGARLTVRITTIFLTSGSNDGFGSIVSFDTVEGEARVTDAKGRLLKRQKLIAHQRPLGFRQMDASEEPRRVAQVLATFAYWVPRQVRP